MPPANQPTPPQIQGLRAVGKLAASQVLRAIDAYEKRDVQAAMAMREDDARLDALYTALFRELLTYMIEDPRNITACTHLLFMAKNLERVGDHATNIAENLWFLVHGDTPLPAREKADRTSGN
jgi:phosphate transport system protein